MSPVVNSLKYFTETIKRSMNIHDLFPHQEALLSLIFLQVHAKTNKPITGTNIGLADILS